MPSPARAGADATALFALANLTLRAGVLGEGIESPAAFLNDAHRPLILRRSVAGLLGVVQGNQQLQRFVQRQQDPTVARPQLPRVTHSHVVQRIPQQSEQEIAEEFRAFAENQDYSPEYFSQPRSGQEILSFINDIIESFPDGELRRQIGASLQDRKDFLIGMTQYLGSLSSVILHFANVRRADVAGEIHLHEDAASRIEIVAAALAAQRLPMPTTSIGLGLRDRYRPNDHHSRSKMAHPLGYAIDYRARENPQLADPRLRTFLEVATGESYRFQFQDEGGRPLSYESRRALIREMGSSAAAGQFDEETRRRAERFLTQFEGEYHRVSAASRRLRENINSELRQLADLWTQTRELRQSEGRLRRSRRSADREELTRVREQTQENDRRLREADLELVFEPWLTQMRQEMDTAVQELSGLEITLRTAGGETTVHGADLRDARGPRFRQLLGQVDRQRGVSPVQKQEQKATIRQIQDRAERYQRLEPLHRALSGDFRFIFTGESEVRNPSLMQLITVGFFNPDADEELLSQEIDERPEPSVAGSSQHGFSLRFMQLMAIHGFDQGSSWPTAYDPMHFEFVAGVDSIQAG